MNGDIGASFVTNKSVFGFMESQASDLLIVLKRFPDAKYANVSMLCRRATTAGAVKVVLRDLKERLL